MAGNINSAHPFSRWNTGLFNMRRIDSAVHRKSTNGSSRLQTDLRSTVFPQLRSLLRRKRFPVFISERPRPTEEAPEAKGRTGLGRPRRSCPSEKGPAPRTVRCDRLPMDSTAWLFPLHFRTGP